VLENWHPQPEGARQRGGQVQYSDTAIECLLMLRAHMHQLKESGILMVVKDQSKGYPSP